MSQNCACCTTPPAPIPAEIENRPWLSAITYRIGTFGTFRKAIFDELSRTSELASLTSRVPDDYTITAIELWSAVADVLTFYQERIANDAFLRTVTDRDPLLRLVRLIGYHLARGSAGTVEVALTLEPDSSALVPARTRVQSVPAEGEKAQKFETLAPVIARASLNRLRVFPAPVPASPTSAGQIAAIVAPDPAALTAAAALARGDRVAMFAPNALEFLSVRGVASRDDRATVTWADPISGDAFGSAFDANDPAIQARKLGRTFHVFGFDVGPEVIVPDSTVIAGTVHFFLTKKTIDLTLDLTLDGNGANQVSLDARYGGLQSGNTLLAVASPPGNPIRAIPFRVESVVETIAVRTAGAAATSIMAASATVTRLTLASLTGEAFAQLVDGGNDIRHIAFHELLGEPLRFWPYSFDARVQGREVFLPGRRVGSSTIEVGRSIEKGAYKDGELIEAGQLEEGRRVLLIDGGAHAPAGASISNASLVGTNIELSPAANDATLDRLGLGSAQATRTTVVASRRLGATVSFRSLRPRLTVRIGASSARPIELSPAGSATIQVAAALQAAIRDAVPGAPTFARALAWVLDDAILVAAGIPGDSVSFGPSTNDGDTINSIGLHDTDATWLDGIVSAPIAPLVGTSVSGSIKVAVGIVQPLPRQVIATPITDVASLATMLATALSFDDPSGRHVSVSTRVTSDGRILVLPPQPKRQATTFLRVSLETDGPLSLDATTATLLGNVAPASHGETVSNEIVGDGDAARAFQRFTLKKKPITYVPAAVPGGVSSSIEVFVNGVLWAETPTLYTAGPLDQVYITRMADDGTMTMQFGDGVTGSRLPTGRDNVVARYRSGTGLAGRVRAGALATLLDRPTGVKSVTNPLPADGGAEPETMTRAREAAPGTVRTFGRAVALRDFEDTALMAGEVAKALATWVWTGERRAIHVTLAGQAAGTFSAEGLERLRATLATERDPNHKLILANYVPVAIVMAATVLVDDRHVTEQVLSAARAAILAALSFERRHFAEPVFLSDVVSQIQRVDGVKAVDLDTLDLKSSDTAFRLQHGIDPALGQLQPRLLMLPARPGSAPDVILPAELAVIEAPAQDLSLRAIGGISA